MDKFHIENLSCPNCALKIENAIKELEGVNDASLNLMGQSLQVQSTLNQKELLKKVQKIADEIEPGTKFYLEKPASETDRAQRQLWLELGIASSLFVLGVANAFNQQTLLYLLAYLVSGYRVLKQAFKNILKLDFFDEFFLMTLATLGALLLGETFEAVAVMLFYMIGEALQNKAMDQSKKDILSLMDTSLNPVTEKETGLQFDPRTIKTNTVLLIYPGEKIQLDGHIVKGNSHVDTSTLTGESTPRSLKVGDQVLDSMINLDSILEMKVDKEYDQSTLAQMLEMLENAPSKKAQTEKMITRFSRFYTPFVVMMAMIIAFIFPFIFKQTEMSSWIHRALIFLVASCPCALVVSVPLSYFAGLGKASKENILVKAASTFEEALKIKNIFFDKTGTITKGNFKVIKYSNDKTLYLAALLEQYSKHPIAQAILTENKQDLSEVVTRFREISGQGLAGKIDGQEILVGNHKLMEAENIDYESETELGTIVYVALKGEFVGSIVIADEVKESSQAAIQTLNKEYEVALVSGDHQNIVKALADQFQIKHYYAQLYPQDKLMVVSNQSDPTLFVGDGINDALVLQHAHLGVAMGKLGSDIAIEAADVILAKDDLNQLPIFFKISKKVHDVVKFNIVMALLVKALVLILGVLGYSNMLMAVFADVGVALLAILNALRIYK